MFCKTASRYIRETSSYRRSCRLRAVLSKSVSSSKGSTRQSFRRRSRGMFYAARASATSPPAIRRSH
jgi:hypothetical protein